MVISCYNEEHQNAHVMKLEAYDIYKLDGEVPKTRMLGETSDISPLFKLKWFEWVMFHDETPPFPVNVLKSGHYLGLTIDVGPTMTANIFTKNRLTYRPSAPD